MKVHILLFDDNRRVFDNVTNVTFYGKAELFELTRDNYPSVYFKSHQVKEMEMS